MRRGEGGTRRWCSSIDSIQVQIMNATLFLFWEVEGGKVDTVCSRVPFLTTTSHGSIPFLWKELARPDKGQRVRGQHGHRGLQHATADPLGEVLASKAQSCAGALCTVYLADSWRHVPPLVRENDRYLSLQCTGTHLGGTRRVPRS